MATFLDLTNELLRRLNEVTINETDFSAIRNIQALAKDSINSSTREILQTAQEWPFTIITYEQTLTAGQKQYDFPANYSKADWETFYIKKLVNNTPQKLKLISYDQYISNYRTVEDQNEAGGYQSPQYIYMTQDSKFGVTPIPDDSYVLEYRYWIYPTDLTLSTDVCVVPDRFKHIVIDGAMMYIMRFRSNEQSAQIHEQKFKNGIESMRRLLLTSFINVTSTVSIRNLQSSTFGGSF